MSLLRIIGLSACFATLLGCQTSTDSNKLSGLTCLEPREGMNTPCRPPRVGLYKIDPELDEKKPLATIDQASWIVEKTRMYGLAMAETLACFKLPTLEKCWQVELPATVAAPMYSDSKQIVVGLRDGSLSSYAKRDGKLLWKTDIGRYLARPLTPMGEHQAIAVSVDQQVFAIDLRNGENLWIVDAGKPTGLVVSGIAPPLVTQKEVIVALASGDIVALNKASGKLLWQYRSAFSEQRFREPMGQLSLYGKLLLVTRNDGKAFALDVSRAPDVSVIWEQEFGAITTSTIRNSSLYLGLLNGDVIALDASSGSTKWRLSLSEPISSILAGEKALYLTGSEGLVAVIERQSPELLWVDRLESTISQEPVIFDKILHVATGLRVIYRYEL